MIVKIRNTYKKFEKDLLIKDLTNFINENWDRLFKDCYNWQSAIVDLYLDA